MHGYLIIGQILPFSLCNVSLLVVGMPGNNHMEVMDALLPTPSDSDKGLLA